MVDDYSSPPAIRRSTRLHGRVRAFAEFADRGTLVPPVGADTFESLALDIARFQYDYSAGFARLVAHQGTQLQTLGDIPPVPSDAFRLSRVAAHPPELDEAVFMTSGTTAQCGRHPVRDLSTKEDLTLRQARKTLFKNDDRGLIVALADQPHEPQTSSLTHMMSLFMRHFDGRPLSADPGGVPFDERSPGRFLTSTQGVDVEGLARAARLAIHRSEPLFVLSTSFALLAALEALDGEKIRTPQRTTLMITGGFKGKHTSLSESDLRAAASVAFGVASDDIIAEYGMTELSSQMFERPGSGLYEAPPWLSVQALDPSTHKPLPEGEQGLGHFIDLCNIDSCPSVLTQDLIAVTSDGIQLFGRAPRATPRGCSLPYEGLLSPAITKELKPHG